MGSSKMFFRKAANASSSLQDMMMFCTLFVLGGFDTRLEIASLIRVVPSVTSNPYFDTNSVRTFFETL